MPEKLAQKTCIPCKAGVLPLTEPRSAELLRQVEGWETVRNHHLRKEFSFPDFIRALAAVTRIGTLAEEQGHHPNLHLAWGKVGVEIWTHRIDGLTESDFILAAKIDEVI